MSRQDDVTLVAFLNLSTLTATRQARVRACVRMCVCVCARARACVCVLAAAGLRVGASLSKAPTLSQLLSRIPHALQHTLPQLALTTSGSPIT